MTHLRCIDWEALAELVATILVTISENPSRFEAEARLRDITIEQLKAAAIVEAIRDQVEGGPFGAAA